MRLASKDTIYKKKMIFNALLSEELGKMITELLLILSGLEQGEFFRFKLRMIILYISGLILTARSSCLKILVVFMS